jgi:hypothetical protein
MQVNVFDAIELVKHVLEPFLQTGTGPVWNTAPNLRDGQVVINNQLIILKTRNLILLIQPNAQCVHQDQA